MAGEIMNDSNASMEELCTRLAEIKDVYLPRKRPDNDGEKDEEELSIQKRSIKLKNYFDRSPIKFLQRYHTHIKPKEISCFNDLSENDQVEYYIKKICHQQDLESRTQLDSHYITQEVKNRRYRALQNMIKDGDYFSEEEMEKRSPDLYDYYIGRFLTTEEKEEKLRKRAAAHPVTLSGFFMEVIESKQDQEDADVDDEKEEFDEDSEEEEEGEDVAVIPPEEKIYLANEFKSRMYQHFLDGLDKNFSYESVDDNAEYDDLTQIEQDVEDDYFDEEEPSDAKTEDSGKCQQEDDEDELDKYMRTLENPKQEEDGDISRDGKGSGFGKVEKMVS